MRQRLFLVALASLVLLGGGAVAYWLTNKSDNPQNSVAQSVTRTTKNAAAAKLKGSYLVSGDVFWGRGIDYYAQQTVLKYDWPFSGLKTFHPELYDGWISDMECPVTDRTVPYQTQVDKLILQCPPAYTASAAKYFTAFTLANNHTDNTGPEGFADTRTNLGKAGIQFFGYYDLSQKQDLCEVITLPAKLNGKPAEIPIAMCGYHWLARDPTTAELAQISNYAKYFPVWVFPHGGTEYAIHHSPQQQALYRQMIDLGADAVFGDHPHVVEDTAAYKGKLIVYNFGNLIYDQWFDDEVTKSLIVNVSISALADANLKAYLKMAKSCVAFKDDCLKTAQTRALVAPKFQYNYKILAGDSSNASLDSRLKRQASPAVYQWLLKRTDWSQTLQGLR